MQHEEKRKKQNYQPFISHQSSSQYMLKPGLFGSQLHQKQRNIIKTKLNSYFTKKQSLIPITVAPHGDKKRQKHALSNSRGRPINQSSLQLHGTGSRDQSVNSETRERAERSFDRSANNQKSLFSKIVKKQRLNTQSDENGDAKSKDDVSQDRGSQNKGTKAEKQNSPHSNSEVVL